MNDHWKEVFETIVGIELWSDAEKQQLYDKIMNDIYLSGNSAAEEKKPKRKTPAQLRKEHPALQDAWEKYQLVLKLIRTNEDVETEEQNA